ncbi:SusC/RagA family TonB-linked outer membrane protein [Dysgonomonas reticulitermitis]
MKKKETISKLRSRWLILLLFVLCLSQNTFAQTFNITGEVKDASGEPLIGVTVTLKGSNKGVITDVDGNFKITCSKGNVLRFTYTGHIAQEVKIESEKKLEVIMIENSLDLDEVIVVGYGVQKKRDITGAIASVDSKSIEEKSPVNIFQALQGAAPGLQITSASGAPGAENMVILRGASTFSDGGVAPLYIVDNVITSSIDNINPSDVKSIEVLKDAASASIYGARSANGVIIITTKAGEAGKPKVDLSYLRSYRSMARKVPQVNNFERVLNLQATNFDDPSKTLEKFGVVTDSVGMTNSENNFYQDLLTQTAIRNDYKISISGGQDRIKYLASFGLVNDEGIIKTSYNDRITGRYNMDFQAWPTVKFTTRVSFSNMKTNSISEGNVLQTSMRRPTNMIIYYPDGSFAPYYDMGGNRNPVQELYGRENKRERFQGTIYQGMEWNLTKNLILSASAQADLGLTRYTQFTSKELDSNANEDLRKNSSSDKTTFNQKYAGDMFLAYSKTFNSDHNLSAMIGTSVEMGKSEYLNFAGSYLVTEAIQTMNMVTAWDLANTYTSGEEYAIASFFGRLSYSYKGRYLFNSTVRRDGSSRFGPNKRWGTFPSASLGWRFSDEPFMSWATNILTDGKLRGSWGITGNDRVGYYEYQTMFTAGKYSYNGIGGVVPVSTFGNPNLHWEETKQTNFGLDLTFLNGRAGVIVDYYIKNTKDLLSSMNLPYTTGYDDMRVNLASIENKGLEISLNGYPVRTKDFIWGTTINWWKNRNTITDLAKDDYVQSNLWMVAKGKPAGQWYGYKNLGVYQYDVSNAYTEDFKTRLNPVLKRDDNNNVIIGLNGQPTLLGYTLPDGTAYAGSVKQMRVSGENIAKGGDVIWENRPDTDGNYDGYINEGDKYILGNANPDWHASWNNDFTYKNFTFSFNFYLSWGGLVYNGLKRYYTTWGGNTHMQHPDYIRTGWKYQGQDTPWYALNTRQRATNNANTGELNSMYLEDASFLRLKNVKLTYNLNSKYVKKTPLRSCQVYVYANNLLTWTNYSGYDPEIGGSVLTPGRDNSAYPRYRELGFGINVGF